MSGTEVVDIIMFVAWTLGVAVSAFCAGCYVGDRSRLERVRKMRGNDVH
jgi:hypothetical protein